MSLTANVPITTDDDKDTIKRLTADISEEFDLAVNEYCKDADIARSSIIRAAVAEYVGYADRVVGEDEDGNPIMELALVKRSDVYKAAGIKRAAAMGTTRKKASQADALKAALASGDVTIEQLKAMMGL